MKNKEISKDKKEFTELALKIMALSYPYTHFNQKKAIKEAIKHPNFEAELPKMNKDFKELTIPYLYNFATDDMKKEFNKIKNLSCSIAFDKIYPDEIETN